MKKQVALAVAAALSLSVAGTALAAPANPFVDVPANHWAYDALASLQKDGVVTGYGDGTFRGDRNLTRYEMAAMIAKITNVDDKNGPLIKRLQSEFATELYNLGVRVDKLEKGASTIKFTGAARIRYQNGGNLDNAKNPVAASRWQTRVHLNMSSTINDNVKFFGRLVGVNESNARSGDATDASTFRGGAVFFDRAEFAWKQNNWGISAGRMLPLVGHGIFAWNNRADGFIGSYNDGKFSFLAGLLDFGSSTNETNPTTQHTNMNMTLAQLGYQFTDKFGMTAMYAAGHGEGVASKFTADDQYKGVAVNKFKPWAIGANVQFAQDWDLRGEYLRNTGDVGDADKNAYFARLTYGKADMKKVGSYAAYVEYLKFGEASGAVAGNGSRFDAYQDLQNRKGWGVGLTYVVGKNHNMQLFYHDVKQSTGDTKVRKQYTIATNFVF